MRRYVLISLGSSLVIAIAMTLSDCRRGTYEQCLYSKSFFWVYWIGLFLFVLLVVAVIGKALRRVEHKDNQE